MKKILLFLCLSLCGATLLNAQNPIVTFTTAKNLNENISFKITANANTAIEIDYGSGKIPVTLTTYKEEVLSGTLTASEVKIYGDATHIIRFTCSNNKITNLDVSGLTDLNDFDCIDNQLTNLDVSKNRVLGRIYANSNKLTSIDVSKNRNLYLLYCSSNLLETLDFTGATSLQSISIAENKLTGTLDISMLPVLYHIDCGNNNLTSIKGLEGNKLEYLACHNNEITDLNVSKLSSLKMLSCAWNKLTTLDVSKNTALTELDCSENLLTSLDVSKNIALTRFECYSNLLAELDASKNTELKRLSCHNNNLTTLDVYENAAFTELSCGNNALTIATLPLNTSDWSTSYYYLPQRNISLPQTDLNIGDVIDLSDQLFRDDSITTYNWYAGSTLLELEKDYAVEDGKTTFFRAFNDSVYCKMENTRFPSLKNGYALKTWGVKISDPSSIDDNLQDKATVTTDSDNNINIQVSETSVYDIYNMSGRLIESASIDAGEHTVNVKQDGLYLVKISTKTQSVTYKVLLSRN